MNLKKESWTGNKILVIDDNIDICSVLKNILIENDYIVKTANSAELGLQMIKDFSPSIILCDINLPTMSGFELLDEVKKRNSDFDVIMITAHGDITDAVKAMQMGAFDYITKPFTSDAILMVIRKALSTQHLQGEVRRLRSLLNDDNKSIIGESAQIKRVLRYIDLIAPTDLNVLVRGNSGTGKKVTSRTIQQQSTRVDEVFIEVDCGAIPDSLMEATLFGYEIGASEVSKGKFELAQGGTIFLDNITKLSLKAQDKLLQTLESKTLSRIGTKDNVPIDVRVITASSGNFRKLIKKNKFREDLYYRLNEFEMVIPELTSRLGDVIILAEHFIKLANNKYEKSIKDIDQEAKQLLVKYSWPGNVRELQNVINRAVLICHCETISIEHVQLTDEVRRENIINLNGIDILEAKEIIEQELIKEALLRADHNKSRAAELLGYSRKTLYTKLAEHNLC